jgi:protoporphyrin/coproporphyrin ferrochelatase
MSPGGPHLGVVLMAHGTPAGPDDLERFVTEVRRGRAPDSELLSELARRYEAIGGASPLAERTRWHAHALQSALDRERPGEFTVELGYKFASPRIEDAVSALGRAGVHRATGVVLAPHYSQMSVGDYAKRAEVAGRASEAAVEVSTVGRWYLAPGFVPLLAERVRRAVADLPEEDRARATVVFTAHSLPERITESGDPYPEQLRESAVVVAAAADVERFCVGWQSAGRSTERWLGPDVAEVIEDLARTGSSAVVVCPIGFVSEHLEVLYDLDVEAAAAAQSAGIRFARTEMLDGDPRLADVLAGVVLAEGEGGAGDDAQDAAQTAENLQRAGQQ